MANKSDKLAEDLGKKAVSFFMTVNLTSRP